MNLIKLMLVIFLFSVTNVYSATEIIFTADYGIKNIILLAILIVFFLFWVWIYYAFTEEIKFDKDNILNTINNFIIRTVCFVWYFVIFYTAQGVFLISTSDTYLLDKLELLFKPITFTLIILGILGIINLIKIFNKLTQAPKHWKEFLREIKTGGRR